MENLGANLVEIFGNWGLNTAQAEAMRGILMGFGIILLAIIGNWITKRIIIKIVEQIIKHSKNEYDDIFVQKGVFNNLSHLVPAAIIYFMAPLATDNHLILSIINDFVAIYVIIALTLVSNAFLNALNDIYAIISEKKGYKLTLKQYIQVIKILVYILDIILIISILLSQKPGNIIAGLGAMTAVLMLIFRDTILGFVAGIQLSAYDMVHEGDWITLPSRGIDGDVLDINLTTVKIRNFDKTIATVPTYALIQESFINWKGMQMAGGRRIKRALYVDLQTIEVVKPELIERLEKSPLMADFIQQVKKELGVTGQSDAYSLLTGKAYTNVSLFREYIERYLHANLRVYKKYQKQKFVRDGVEIERFVIDDPDDFIKELGSSVRKFLREIDGKTVLENVTKFLLEYSEHYMLENNYLYKIHLVRREIIRKGALMEVQQPEKFLVKDGLFCDDLTLLVRDLSPTDKGLPIEIYVFAATTDWAEYEQIQSELFEHLVAVAPLFGLSVFQYPSNIVFSGYVSGADQDSK